MKMNKRLDRLEEEFLCEPTFLLMADGDIESITGPKDHFLTLFNVATGGASATPKQASDLALIRDCEFGIQPGGARMLELLQSFYAGPVDWTDESDESA